MLYPAELRARRGPSSGVGRPASIGGSIRRFGRNEGNKQGHCRDTVVAKRLRLFGRCLAVDQILGRAAFVHRARRVGELAADPARPGQHLGLFRGK